MHSLHFLSPSLWDLWGLRCQFLNQQIDSGPVPEEGYLNTLYISTYLSIYLSLYIYICNFPVHILQMSHSSTSSTAIFLLLVSEVLSRCGFQGRWES